MTFSSANWACWLKTCSDISEGFSQTPLPISILPLRWFNSTLSERAHFSAYGTASPQPAWPAKTCPLTPYPPTNTSTHSHLCLLYLLCFTISTALHTLLSFFYLAPLLLCLAMNVPLSGQLLISAVCSGVLVLWERWGRDYPSLPLVAPGKKLPGSKLLWH